MILVRIPLALLSNIMMEFNYVIGFVIVKKVKKDRLWHNFNPLARLLYINLQLDVQPRNANVQLSVLEQLPGNNRTSLH